MARKIEIQIPTNWNDITIGMYQKYLEVVDSKKSDIDKANEIISMFCNIEKSLVSKINIKELNMIVQKIHKFINKREVNHFKKIIFFKGKKYGFIPNLSKLTTGEYVDIDNYCKDTNKNLHRIMSILYRRVTVQKKNLYNIESYVPDEIVEEEFKDLSMDVALSSIDFFLRLGMDLTKDFSNYLIVSRNLQKKEVYPQNGDGII